MSVENASWALPDTYFTLVREFPLTHIRDDRQLSRAQEVLDGLLRRDLDEGGEAYLDALTDLVAVFEDAHRDIPDAPAGDVLRELVASSGLSQEKLARSVGIAPSTISAVIQGNRKLTTEQVVKLARHFHVSPTVFLPA